MFHNCLNMNKFFIKITRTKHNLYINRTVKKIVHEIFPREIIYYNSRYDSYIGCEKCNDFVPQFKTDIDPSRGLAYCCKCIREFDEPWVLSNLKTCKDQFYFIF